MQEKRMLELDQQMEEKKDEEEERLVQQMN